MTTASSLLRAAHASRTLVDIAKVTGLSVSFLCDVEHGRRSLNPQTAAHIARVLGGDPCEWVRVVLQQRLADSGLAMTVAVSP
jgi:transcriptional regulator with XRE-family HTH domain